MMRSKKMEKEMSKDKDDQFPEQSVLFINKNSGDQSNEPSVSTCGTLDKLPDIEMEEPDDDDLKVVAEIIKDNNKNDVHERTNIVSPKLKDSVSGSKTDESIENKDQDIISNEKEGTINEKEGKVCNSDKEVQNICNSKEKDQNVGSSDEKGQTVNTSDENDQNVCISDETVQKVCSPGGNNTQNAGNNVICDEPEDAELNSESDVDMKLAVEKADVTKDDKDIQDQNMQTYEVIELEDSKLNEKTEDIIPVVKMKDTKVKKMPNSDLDQDAGPPKKKICLEQKSLFTDLTEVSCSKSELNLPDVLKNNAQNDQNVSVSDEKIQKVCSPDEENQNAGNIVICDEPKDDESNSKSDVDKKLFVGSAEVTEGNKDIQNQNMSTCEVIELEDSELNVKTDEIIPVVEMKDIKVKKMPNSDLDQDAGPPKKKICLEGKSFFPHPIEACYLKSETNLLDMLRNNSHKTQGKIYSGFDAIAPMLSSLFESRWKSLLTDLSPKHTNSLQRDRELLQQNMDANKVAFEKCVEFINYGNGLKRNFVNGQFVQTPVCTPNLICPTNTEFEGLQIVSIVSGTVEPTLPPIGDVKLEPPKVGDKVYAMKTDLLGVWCTAIIKEGSDQVGGKVKVQFKNNNCTFVISKKHIACESHPPCRLMFGRRVIALYTPEDKNIRPEMYAGIIAEPMKSTNQYRYLIFFDDGVAQYISHENVRLVYEESKNVWEDIAPNFREFTKAYIQQFPERPMLKLQKGQVIKADFDGKWLYAHVEDVEGSMVKLLFDTEGRFEWIYRGSTRLALLRNELEKAAINRMTGKVRRNTILRRNQRDAPYVEYTRNVELEHEDVVTIDSDSDDDTDTTHSGTISESATSETEVVRNVARKSTTQSKRVLRAHIIRTVETFTHKEGQIYKCSLPRGVNVKKYRKHKCSSILCAQDIDMSKHKGKNPLIIPMYVGFVRQIHHVRRRGAQLAVSYRTPCGKTLRTLEEVTQYLFRTQSSLSVDQFCFDQELFPFQSFRTTKEETLWSVEDISEGRENTPIPCVNCLTNEKPPYVEYATERFPGKDVVLNLDEEFLCGCDCTDNCQDPTKCACQQITIHAASKDGSATDIGYRHRRLMEPVVTGVYECNSRCGCSKSCTNRVVQHGLQIRLQMFKTERKGWGIRCVDDVDAGRFLCIYAGQLLTEESANEDGKLRGDEYLAELDHIDVAEKQKDGYESDVAIDIDVDVEKISGDEQESEDSDDKMSTTSDCEGDVWQLSDSDYEGSNSGTVESSSYSTRSRKPNIKKKSFMDLMDADSEKDHERPVAPFDVTLSDQSIRTEPPRLTSDYREVSPETESWLADMDTRRKPNFGTSKHLGAKKSSASRPAPLPSPPSTQPPKVIKTIRDFYNEDFVYIMDAKTKGNIGRYLNHSCNPNCFVQNVFWDTHDLRFPTVAFFAYNRIPAGTELTWDYNYEIGSVEGKSLLCYCAAKNCRLRLL